MKNRAYIVFLFFLASLDPTGSLGADCKSTHVPSQFRDLIYAEQKLNSVFQPGKTVKTDVDAQYLPGSSKIFEIPYIEVPEESLHLMKAASATTESLGKIIFKKDGINFVRFLIHPESLKLYAPVLAKFPIQGFLCATPTASTRTLLVWEPASPEATAWIGKTSLAKEQGELGRIIPDWEVRRGAAITDLVASTPLEEWKKNGVEIVSEPAGVYFDESFGMGSKVDDHQGTIYKHGMIFRDATQLMPRSSKEIVIPGFSLTSERKGRPPIIIEMWKKSGLDWDSFFKEKFLRPIVESTNYLTMVQGILPQMHPQNFLLRINSETLEIESVLHRDLGSMKPDLRLRWVNGLSNAALRTENPVTDLKIPWSTSLQGETLLEWFHESLFTDKGWELTGNATNLKKWIPDYSEEKSLKAIQDLIKEGVKKYWGIEAKSVTIKSIEKYANEYIAAKAPKITATKLSAVAEEAQVRKFLELQKSRKQIMELKGFKTQGNFGTKDYMITEDGVVFMENKVLKLALYSEGFDSETVKTTARLRSVPIGKIYSGQASVAGPRVQEHLGHSIKKDKLYVFKAIQAGTKDNPTFTLVSDVDRAAYLAQKKGLEELELEVVEDLTGLTQKEQEKILEARGYFWTPENETGKYSAIGIKDVKADFRLDRYFADLNRYYKQAWTLEGENSTQFRMVHYLWKLDAKRRCVAEKLAH